MVAALLVFGINPFAATLAAALAGAAAGVVTALIHTRLRINAIIAGIIVMTAVYTVDLRVMGRANTPLLSTPSVFGDIVAAANALGLPIRESVVTNIVILAVFVVVVAMLMASFLRTDLGLAVRATGENETMIQALGVDTGWTKIVGLALSNFLIALSGALVAQNHGFADIGMGIGILVTVPPRC